MNEFFRIVGIITIAVIITLWLAVLRVWGEGKLREKRLIEKSKAAKTVRMPFNKKI